MLLDVAVGIRRPSIGLGFELRERPDRLFCLAAYPVTVAWLNLPSISGWMGMRDISFGAAILAGYDPPPGQELKRYPRPLGRSVLERWLCQEPRWRGNQSLDGHLRGRGAEHRPIGKPAGERALGAEVSLTPAPFASRLKQDGRVCFLDRLGRINLSGHAFPGEDCVDLFPDSGVEFPSHRGDVFLWLPLAAAPASISLDLCSTGPWGPV